MREGDRIGRYAVVRQLGRGGMGRVVVAHDPALGRDVAVKLMLATTRGDPTLAERFRREAETAGRLHHPHIVRVHEAGLDHAGRPFIVQELVEGESLQERLDRDGPLPPPEAAALARDLAQALAHAHERGVVHRDLKPANILLRAQDGRALIGDFGLAKDALALGALTRTGELLGTVTYMAPEQAGEGAKHVDAKADVHALGATLYALLTGRPPFVGASPVNVLAQVIGQSPVPPSRLRPGIPPALEALCLRCLEKRRERRPSADDVARELEALLARRPATIPRRTARRPGLPVALALAATGLAAAGLTASRHAPAPAPPSFERPPSGAVAPPPTPPPVPATRRVLTGWRWSRRSPLTILQPPALLGASAVFDPSRRAVVFAGGWDPAEKIMQLTIWTWDGDVSAFAAELPSRRAGMGLAALGGRLLFIQGDVVGATSLRDAWALGGADERRWFDLSPPPEVAPRSRAGCVAIADRGLCLLFGGRSDKRRREHLADLWSVTADGRWEDLTRSGPQPPARHSAAVAYDHRRRRVILFGGEDVDGYRSDLWAWTPAEGWTLLHAPGPRARAEGSMAFDGQRCVLFGGVTGSPADRVALDDVWALDDAGWAEVVVEGPRPSPRHLTAFAWDERRQRGVLFGGGQPGGLAYDELWELQPPGP